MKKILIGIIFLMAGMILTSPASGALENPWSPSDGPVFSFEVDPLEVLDLSRVRPGDPFVAAAINSKWDLSLDKTPFEKFDSLGGKSGYVTFSNPVEIVLAKWGGPGGGSQWAFLLDGNTETFAWDGLPHDMSHANGYNPVPLPAAIWLLGSGLLVVGVVAVRRRRT